MHRHGKSFSKKQFEAYGDHRALNKRDQVHFQFNAGSGIIENNLKWCFFLCKGSYPAGPYPNSFLTLRGKEIRIGLKSLAGARNRKKHPIKLFSIIPDPALNLIPFYLELHLLL